MRNPLLWGVVALYGFLYLVNPELAVKGLSSSGYYLKEMAMIMPVVFLLTVAIDVLLPNSLIIKHLGRGAGPRGSFFALLLGSVSAGPIYAAFPIASALLKKGASVGNVVVVLCAWAVIKVPMLVNELQFLGFDFMVARWGFTVLGILLIGFLMDRWVRVDEVAMDPGVELGASGAAGAAGVAGTTGAAGATGIRVDQKTCVGCGICVRLSPGDFEMVGKKAKFVGGVRSQGSELEALQGVIEKCPVWAIKKD